jgi:hydroxyacylglutathione hydrolase
MLEFQTFIGGIFDTNCYLLHAPAGQILIDAPTGAAKWLQENRFEPMLLLITHGHVDHVDDAAKIKRQFGCQVGYHEAGIPLITDPNFFKDLGFFFEVQPVKPDFLVTETADATFAGLPFEILLVPGHCPGSLCFYVKNEGLLFGGDVLFSGSIGRTDLPGGDFELLLSGIRSKILRLPEQTRVLSGHGPPTTIGYERLHNPFLIGYS